MKTLTVLASAALLIAPVACKNTADGIKKDANVAAEKTSDAAAKAGSAVDAATQTAQVKAALAADSRVDAGGINVDTDKAAMTVTLKGTVPMEAQKAIASDIARTKAGDYRVVNELTVKPK